MNRARNWRDGPRIPSLILFALVALLLVGGLVAVFQTLAVERAEREQVERTNAIAGALRDSSRALVDAETGQRGYVITADPEYLAPYLNGRRDWPEAQAELERQLAPIADPEQKALLRKIRRLGDSKLAELGDTVAQVEAGQTAAARQRVLTGEGRSTMAEYRQAIRRLEQIENDILSEAVHRADKAENRLVPILIALGIVIISALGLGIWQMFRVARAEAAAASAALVAQQRDRADLLSRELNHRVKNLFAVIQAIVQMSLRSESDTVAAGKKIGERLQALSTAHNVTQGHLDTPVAGLEDLIRTAVAPYESDTTRLIVDGPAVEVVAEQITPLGMILHELVTNCVKYGAWSNLSGQLIVRWAIRDNSDRCIDLDWIEEATGPVPDLGPDGFGSRMMAASAQQLDGAIHRQVTDKGLHVTLRFARH